MWKTSTELERHALSGPTMGTRWSALFYAPRGLALTAVQHALQSAVDEVDRQLSTWRADSDLMRLNRAAIDELVEVPADLVQVLRLGLRIGQQSGGAFDIGLGDAVQAWGFGPREADEHAIRAALATRRRPAHEVLDVSGHLVRKRHPLTLDLNGIAKGHGVDRLASALQRQGINAGLVGIDGELRAMGLQPDGQAWAIAVEAPQRDRRAAHSMLLLHDAAVATSGDYRHGVQVQGRWLSHTMDPRRGAPLRESPASVTVVAATCAEADAWATALMVMGPEAGAGLARQHGLSVLYLLRDEAGGVHAQGHGPLCSPAAAS